MNRVTASPEEGLGARHGTVFTLGEHSARHLRRILRLHLPQLSTAVDGLSELSDLPELPELPEDGRGVGIVEAVTDRSGRVPLTDPPGGPPGSSETPRPRNAR
jgi:hypothetical protein